jgi:hypothetical protein
MIQYSTVQLELRQKKSHRRSVNNCAEYTVRIAPSNINEFFFSVEESVFDFVPDKKRPDPRASGISRGVRPIRKCLYRLKLSQTDVSGSFVGLTPQKN